LRAAQEIARSAAAATLTLGCRLVALKSIPPNRHSGNLQYAATMVKFGSQIPVSALLVLGAGATTIIARALPLWRHIRRHDRSLCDHRNQI
jgi:hypothetical protein